MGWVGGWGGVLEAWHTKREGVRLETCLLLAEHERVVVHGRRLDVRLVRDAACDAQVERLGRRHADGVAHRVALAQAGLTPVKKAPEPGVCQVGKSAAR